MCPTSPRAARFLALVTLSAALAQAPATARADVGKPLDVSWGFDGALTGVAGLALFVPELSKDALAPDGCRWCHRDPSGAVNVNGFDRAGRSAFVGLGLTPPTWARTSDVFAFAVLPLLALVSDLAFANGWKLDENFAKDSLLVAQSLFLAGALNQAVKFTAGRERPFVAYDSPFSVDLRHGTETVADDNLSFYSGHSSAAMAVTVSMARIIDLRTGRKVGYFTLIPLGILTSLMRLGADKHWSTDVLTGMAIGAAFGLVVPTLHSE